MTTVLAALDSSLAANPVLVTARALARALGAHVHAVNVETGGDDAPHNAAEAAGVPLTVISGPVVDSVVEAGSREDVVAVVIGARSTRSGPRPLGSTALAVATALPKPVVVVPPVGRIAPVLRRVLVPLEGSVSTSLAPRALVEVARTADLEVVVLHVQEDAFAGVPPDVQEAWAREFLARYCPWGIGSVRLELRIGRAEDVVPAVAEELGCDTLALGWEQRLSPDRAPVVRAALERSHVPVLLVPVRLASEAGALEPIEVGGRGECP